MPHMKHGYVTNKQPAEPSLIVAAYITFGFKVFRKYVPDFKSKSLNTTQKHCISSINDIQYKQTYSHILVGNLEI